MADNDEYEIHPLDRDYSDEGNKAQSKAKSNLPNSPASYLPGLRSRGAFLFFGGLISLVLTMIVLANIGASQWESTVSTINRISALVMLLGGGLIVLAYRLPALQKMAEKHASWLTLPAQGSVTWLIMDNVVLFVALYLMSFALDPSSATTGRIWGLVFMVLLPLAINMIVFHRGIVRAYAIGVIGGIPVYFVLSMFLGIFHGYRRSNSMSGTAAALTAIGALMASGIVSACYVQLILKTRSWQNELREDAAEPKADMASPEEVVEEVSAEPVAE